MDDENERATEAREAMVEALCRVHPSEAIGQLANLLEEIANCCEDQDGLRDATHRARRALRGEHEHGPWCAFCGGRFGHDESTCPDNLPAGAVAKDNTGCDAN